MLLDGLRVVEWCDRLAGAICARILADLGADIIKIETPGDGDALRREQPLLPGGQSALFAYANHGKRAITLDPARPEGAVLLARLLERSTLLITSHTDALAPLGLAAPGPYAANLRLSVLSVTAFGADAAPRPHSDLTLTHHAAYAYHQARPVAAPDRQPPVGHADREAPLAAGVAAASAALWAVLETDRRGLGVHVDCAQADFLAHLLIEPVADYNRGERAFGRKRDDLRGTEIAGGLVWILPCADGLIMVSPREQHQWDRWVALLSHPVWSEDADICGTRESRTEHWAHLQEEMSVWTRTQPRAAIFRAAQAARVACFPISTPRDLLDNEQLRHRQFYDRLTVPGGTIPIPGLPFILRSGDFSPERGRTVTSPGLGAANAAVLGDLLGLSEQEIAGLRDDHVV